MKLLLSRAGIPDGQSKEALRVFLAIFWKDDPEALKLLQEQGMKINIPLHNSEPILTYAAFWGAGRVVAELLRQGIAHDSGEAFYKHPLYQATYLRDPGVLDVLLQHGIHPGDSHEQDTLDVDKQLSEPDRVPEPYHLAILPGDVASQAVGSLLEAGLSSRPECLMVERGEIQKILREHSLQSALSPDRRERLQFGSLLGADVLLWLHTEGKWTTWTLGNRFHM